MIFMILENYTLVIATIALEIQFSN